MGFPCLVDKRFCKTPVKVVVESDELSEDGELVPAFEVETTCNLQMGARASFTKDKEKIELSGVALFIGDLCPSLPVTASKTATINGLSYEKKKKKMYCW